jgi:hypothetical protein
MKRFLFGFLFVGALVATQAGIAAETPAKEAPAAKPVNWSMNATIIEACSCPMFCQCYFNDKPAQHHSKSDHKHFCKFNNAYKVNKGKYGNTKLDGAKFWVAGDLGEDFTKGEMKWAVLTFDKAMTKEQREAVQTIVPQVYPVKWSSFKTAEGDINVWTSDKNMAHAKLDDGKTAEVKLNRPQGMTDDPIVIKNLKYWGAPRNNGFILMPNEVEAYRAGPNAFEFKGTNGFMITFDINSKDVAKRAEAPKAN